MPVTEINHINLRANRDMMHVLRDFYCDIVGLKVGPRTATTSYGFWLYIGDNDVVHIAEYKKVEGSDKVAPDLHVNGTYDHVSFTCTDMPATEAHLTSHHVPYTTRVLMNGVRQVNFKDPAGNGIELNFEEFRNL
jgi:extradiol dioxygenase family protein